MELVAHLIPTKQIPPTGTKRTKKPQEFKHAGISNSKSIQSEVYTPISRGEFESLTKGAERLIDTLEPIEVVHTQISILTPHNITGLSVCECIEPNTYKYGTKVLAYDPRMGTIDDPRMGTLTRDMICQTCHQNTITCPGHIGHIKLAHSIVNPLFRKLLIYTMNIFCKGCYLPLFYDPEKNIIDPEFYELAALGSLGRLKALSERYEGVNSKGHETHIKKFKYVNDLSSIAKSAFTGSDVKRRTKRSTNATEEVKYTQNLQSREKSSIIGRVDNLGDAKDYRYTIYESEDTETGKPVDIYYIKGFLANIESAPSGRKFLDLLDIHNIISSIIIDQLVVIPPVARIFGMVDGEMSIHPLTAKYSNIIKLNITLSKKDPSDRKIALGILYTEIVQLFALIQDEIKGKTGIIRGLSMGKRVDFSGRTVLNPCNSLVFGYIACPEKMRKYHTKPITVNVYNREACLRLYYERRVPYITFNSDPQYTGDRLAVTSKMIGQYEPQIKDVLEIEGMDGDEALFNRQPTLHKQNMMGHKVVYVPGNVFGLLSPYTSPYNADFDGDEGNLHKMQTIDARTEARHIANVGECIMNAQSNKPIMGLVYNSTTAGFLITANKVTDTVTGELKDNIIDARLFNNIIRLLNVVGEVGVNFLNRLDKANNSIDLINEEKIQHILKRHENIAREEQKKSWDQKLDPGQKNKLREETLERRDKIIRTEIEESLIPYIDKYSGKALFSLLFPQDFYYNSFKGSEPVRIRHGILITGRITKDHIGPTSGSIIHHLWKNYGRDRTMLFFTQGQWLLDEYIEKRGFSIGISSFVARPSLVEKKKDEIKEQVDQHEESALSFLNIISTIGTTSSSTQENKINDIINSNIDRAQLGIESLGPITSNMTTLEKEQHEIKIKSFLDIVARVGTTVGLEAISADNPLNIMSNSGAKGSANNTAQIIAIIGQQYIKGNRPDRSMTLGTRTLPYFMPDSETIESNGFIKESFMKGMSPAGMVFHMMASRVGIMDTALKTADTGHMHRRMNKALEDFTCGYNGEIRNMNGSIFQYAYSDGFNAGELIPTRSNALGDVLNFMDLGSVIGKLNSDAGFETI